MRLFSKQAFTSRWYLVSLQALRYAYELLLSSKLAEN
jgi:hypothetical protein